MIGVSVAMKAMGTTTTATCDTDFARFVGQAAREVDGLQVSDEPFPIGGSEDATFFMRRVQELGGKATYVCIGTDLPTSHHTRTFDIQENDLTGGIAALSLAIAHRGAADD